MKVAKELSIFHSNHFNQVPKNYSFLHLSPTGWGPSYKMLVKFVKLAQSFAFPAGCCYVLLKLCLNIIAARVPVEK